MSDPFKRAITDPSKDGASATKSSVLTSQPSEGFSPGEIQLSEVEPTVPMDERSQPPKMNPELYRAVTSGEFKKFKIFAAHLDISEQKTPQGNNLLHVAAQHGHKVMVLEIVGLFRNLEKQINSDGETPLHIAARIRCYDVLVFLRNCFTKDELEIVNTDGDTALHIAVRSGDLDAVKLFLEAKSKLTRITNKAGESPLFVAVDNMFFDIAKAISEHDKCSCSITGRDKMNALHAAAIRMSEGHHQSSEFRVREKLVERARHLKERQDTTGFLNKVIERHGSTAMYDVDGFGRIPLHYAAHFGSVEFVMLCLSPNNSAGYIKDREGMSAIHFAARSGHVEIMKKLMEFYPDNWELSDNKGRTALHVAIESNNKITVDYILKTPSFEGLIHKKDKEGNTPLHQAANQGNLEILITLANRDRVTETSINKAGYTTLDIVQSSMKFTDSEKYYIAWMLSKKRGLTSLKQEVQKMKDSSEKTKVTYEDSEVQKMKDSPAKSEVMYESEAYEVLKKKDSLGKSKETDEALDRKPGVSRKSRSPSEESEVMYEAPDGEPGLEMSRPEIRSLESRNAIDLQLGSLTFQPNISIIKYNIPNHP